jgi:hypothetical protein
MPLPQTMPQARVKAGVRCLLLAQSGHFDYTRECPLRARHDPYAD